MANPWPDRRSHDAHHPSVDMEAHLPPAMKDDECAPRLIRFDHLQEGW